MLNSELIDKAINTPVKGYAYKVKASPFVKWAGGKRSLIPELLKFVPDNIQNYYEPFIGGGALMFAIEQRVTRLYLSDMNPELIMTYKVIQERCDELIEILAEHKSKHSSDYYYTIRAKHELESPVERAARFIYLNKTCYNGLYRVNKSGRFNAPVGRYANPAILDEKNLRSVSDVLTKAKLSWCDFSEIKPSSGDFVYCDPPYDNTYNGYTAVQFGHEQQAELAQSANEWVSGGVNVIISNSDTPYIRELYPATKWTLTSVSVKRYISCNGAERNNADELIISNGRI